MHYQEQFLVQVTGRQAQGDKNGVLEGWNIGNRIFGFLDDRYFGAGCILVGNLINDMHPDSKTGKKEFLTRQHQLKSQSQQCLRL
jgi:hypothetical protein